MWPSSGASFLPPVSIASSSHEALASEPAIYDPSKLSPLPPPIIPGVIYQGDKVLITGDSKAYKTTHCINLAVSVASGTKYCGFETVPTRVLYVNLEIRKEWFDKRVCDTISALGVDGATVEKNLHILNLRGKVRTIVDLESNYLSQYQKGEFGLLVIDPVYKIQKGNENSAADIALFLESLDRIAEDLGTTIVITHHHAKGAQAVKSVEDRASGSGVFARDADVILDINVLEEKAAMLAPATHPGAVPFRIEFVQRSSKQHPPIEGWVDFPAVVPDETGLLGIADFRKSGKKQSRRGDKSRAKVELTTNALNAAMGSVKEIDGSAFMKWVDDRFKVQVGKDWKTVKKYIDPDLFEAEIINNNRNVIRKKT